LAAFQDLEDAGFGDLAETKIIDTLGKKNL